MKNYIAGILVTLFSFYFTSSIFSQKIIDPQAIAERKLQEKRAKESGYGDIEVDNLHREIKKILPFLMTSKYLENREEFILEEEGNFIFVLPIASGESIKSITERYTYDGYIYLYTDKEGKSLTKIILSFERVNILSKFYLKEKRELINPTPNFSEDGKTIDKNDDILITYYETKKQSERSEMTRDEFNEDLLGSDKFNKISELKFVDVKFYDKQLKMMELYKKYLRRTLDRVLKKQNALKLKARVTIQKLLDFK